MKKTFTLSFFKKTGKKGGQTRAARYSKRTLSKWGKMGGRPRKKREA